MLHGFLSQKIEDVGRIDSVIFIFEKTYDSRGASFLRQIPNSWQLGLQAHTLYLSSLSMFLEVQTIANYLLDERAITFY